MTEILVEGVPAPRAALLCEGCGESIDVSERVLRAVRGIRVRLLCSACRDLRVAASGMFRRGEVV